MVPIPKKVVISLPRPRQTPPKSPCSSEFPESIGAADTNADRIITAKEIYTFVADKVSERTAKKQNPVMWGKTKTQFLNASGSLFQKYFVILHLLVDSAGDQHGSAHEQCPHVPRPQTQANNPNKYSEQHSLS
ncbi:MAG: hypothetical protein MR605_05885 [Bacteroidales bacterium]|nr:hypothetical protein [Bacteroidales bacterium]